MRMLYIAAVLGTALPLALCGAASAQTAELTYTPIKGCRAFDTRATAPIGANQVRSFHVGGSAQFPGQGGPAHGCGVPASATAVELSLSTVNASAAGYLTAFAYNAARPATVSLTYPAAFTTTSTQILPVNAANVSVFSSRQTHVAGDVTGYFAPQIAAEINPSGSIKTATSRLISAERFATGNYKLVFDRDVSSCIPVISPTNPGSTPVINTVMGAALYVVNWSPGEVGYAAADDGFLIAVHC
ncbi:MAG: hypothetical protein ABW275_03480 [Hansschlegelia sp.]